MLLRSWSWKIPKRGLWSVLTIRSLQPSTNILALSKAQTTVNDSLSVGESPASVGVVKWDPAYTSLQPSGQQIGAFSGSHSHYCWRSRYPIPSLFQSVCRQVQQLISNVRRPSSTMLTILAFESLKILSRLSSHVNFEFAFTNSLNGCMMGLTE